MYLLLKEDIIKVFGRENWNKGIEGVDKNKGHQGTNKNTNKTETLFKLTDVTKVVNYPHTEILNIENSQNYINVTWTDYSYNCYNQALLQATISKADLTQLTAEMTEQEELEQLYNQGVSGINKVDLLPMLD